MRVGEPRVPFNGKPTLDLPALERVAVAVDRVGSQLREVKTHIGEGVTGVGLEDALNELQDAAYEARSVYGHERARGPAAGGD